MEEDYIAKASITLDAPIAKVWDALVTPALIKQYMFGTEVTCDWKEGGPITWEGDFEGKHYKDKGQIIRCESLRVLQYTHYSPLTGAPDIAANYHTVTLELGTLGAKTVLTVLQDKNSTEVARDHAAKFWDEMLQGIKKVV